LLDLALFGGIGLGRRNGGRGLRGLLVIGHRRSV
jgi:hypothetical protein